MSRRQIAGFTLIELLITVSIAGILLALAVPSFTAWLGNVAIRGNAEAISGAIQLARSEAIRRNAGVQLVFDANGTSWTISQVSDSAVIQQRGAEARADTVQITFEPAAARTLTFGSLGTITDTSPVTALKVDSNTLSAADSREMCVMVTASGGARMCDPRRATANLEASGSATVTKDPQSCQPAVPVVCTPTP
jgi:type IV fimbrial biogenesis protein FimT